MSDEIDDLLQEVNDSEEETSTEITQSQSKEVDASDEEEIANKLVEMTLDDRSKADKLFDLFYDDLAVGQDRSTSSKETIARALELKIDAGKNLIELLKIKDKRKDGNNILINTVPSNKTGIDLNNIKENLDD